MTLEAYFLCLDSFAENRLRMSELVPQRNRVTTASGLLRTLIPSKTPYMTREIPLLQSHTDVPLLHP